MQFIMETYEITGVKEIFIISFDILCKLVRIRKLRLQHIENISNLFDPLFFVLFHNLYDFILKNHPVQWIIRNNTLNVLRFQSIEASCIISRHVKEEREALGLYVSGVGKSTPQVVQSLPIGLRLSDVVGKITMGQRPNE